MKVDYHNVVSSIEVMMPTAHGEKPTEEQVKAFIERAVKGSLWWHVSGSRVVNTATEEITISAEAFSNLCPLCGDRPCRPGCEVAAKR